MPTYEYACPDCGLVEVYQSIKEDALTICPQCQQAEVTRLISGGGGVLFKGDGFWETDYNRSDDYKRRAKEDSGSATTDTPSAPQKQGAKPNHADRPPEPKSAPAPKAQPSTKAQSSTTQTRQKTPPG